MVIEVDWVEGLSFFNHASVYKNLPRYLVLDDLIEETEGDARLDRMLAFFLISRASSVDLFEIMSMEKMMFDVGNKRLSGLKQKLSCNT